MRLGQPYISAEFLIVDLFEETGAAMQSTAILVVK
jgi:hypothetical protein